MASTGAAEMGLVWANYLGRDAPALNAVYIQGSVGSSDEHIKAIPVLKDIYSAELKKWGIVPSVSWGFQYYMPQYFVRVNLLIPLRNFVQKN